MKIKLHIIVLLILAFTEICKSQQLPIYTNYIINNYAYNPAIAGYKPHIVGNLSYRNQWTGFNDAPKTYLLSLHGAFGKQKKAGAGFIINSDNTGLLGKTSGQLTFSYHVKLNKTYKLGFGISTGMIQYRIKLYDAHTIDKGDELLTGNLLSNNVFNSNAGLYLYSHKLFLGISAYQYLGNKITWKDSKSNLSPHFYSTIGYSFDFTRNVTLEPSMLVRFNYPTLFQTDFSIRCIYKKLFWIGISLRVKEATSMLIGIHANEKLTIAYSYDYSISKLKTYNTGTHEFSLAYNFIKKKKKLNKDEEELNDIDNSVKSRLKK